MGERSLTSGRRGRRLLAAVALPMAFVATACGNTNSIDAIREAAGVRPAGTASDQSAAAAAPGQAPSAAADATAAAMPSDAAASVPEAGSAAGTAGGNAVGSATPGGATNSSPAAGSSSSGGAKLKTAAPGAAGSPQAGAGQAAATPSPGGAAGAAGCTTSKAPLVIGSVGAQSGVVGAAVYPGVQGMQAWVAGINAAGGIDCHPLKYVVSDDGSDPARHQSLVKQLVEQQKAIAVVYIDSPLASQASADYLAQKRVPAVGSSEGDIPMYDTPMHFPQIPAGPGAIDMYIVLGAKATVPKGLTKVASIMCQEVTFCTNAEKRVADLAPGLGWKLVSQGKASLSQPDFTAQCLAAQRAGAQAVVIAFESSGARRLAASCAKVNYKAPIIMSSNMVTADMGQDPNMEGAIVGTSALPWFLDSAPAVKELNGALAKYAPGVKSGPGVLIGWTAGKLFEKAARGHVSDSPSSAEVLNGLWSIKGDNLGGLTYNLAFNQDQKAPRVICGWISTITGGKFTSDGKHECQ